MGTADGEATGIWRGLGEFGCTAEPNRTTGAGEIGVTGELRYFAACCF
jgi:hypothetical protein